jgi:predicted glycosyltransferase
MRLLECVLTKTKCRWSEQRDKTMASRPTTIDLWDPAYPEESPTGATNDRAKILFYVQDSWGLGHLQRVSKLARALQNEAECLILCGHREAGWIIPDRCEYLHIPSLNNLLFERAQFLGKRQFLQLSRQQAIAFRRTFIERAIETFHPDVIVVENLALGMLDELSDVLDKTEAVKIFLTRGIIAHPSRVRRFMLRPNVEEALATLFQASIVACDRRVWDLDSEYHLGSLLASKLEYVGYMSEAVDPSDIRAARRERGVDAATKWIVCSAGGGALGEALVQELQTIMQSFTGVVVDLVQGPRSALPWAALLTSTIEQGHMRLHRECRALPLLHAAADLVVCTGGYNSLVETMEGGAGVVALPVQLEPQDEQFLQCSRLAPYYPITLVENRAALAGSIAGALERCETKNSIRETGNLDFDGLSNASKFILSCVCRKPNQAPLPGKEPVTR